MNLTRGTRVALAALAIAAAGCGGDDPTSDMGGIPDPWALSFDGVDDYVQVPDAPALDLTNAVTLSAWYYYPGGVTGHAGLLQKDGASSYGRYGLWVLGDQAEFCISIAGGSQECLFSSSFPAVDTWVHIAGVYDGAEVRVYLDGELDGTQALTGPMSTSDDALYIGGDPTEPTYLIGQLDEVCIWNVARTQSQIQSTMNMRMMGTEAGLVALWHMDEAMGQPVSDATANALHGTRGATSATEASDPTWTSTTWPH